jgi:hypothetical protein
VHGSARLVKPALKADRAAADKAGVRKRPIQIIVVAWLQLLSPLSSFITFHMYTGVNFSGFLQVAWVHADAWTRLRTLLAGPLMFAAIYATKRWSLVVAVSCMVISAAQNIVIWGYYPDPSLMLLLFILLTHGTLIGYLMLPSVRATYLDRKLRWWESKPRYFIKVSTKVSSEKKKFSASILNIAEGGLFLITDHELEIQDKLTIVSDSFPEGLKLVGLVTHHSVQMGERGYGVRFVHDEKTTHLTKVYINQLRSQGVPSSVVPRDWITEIRELAEGIFMHGKGWVPERSGKQPREPYTAQRKKKSA